MTSATWQTDFLGVQGTKAAKLGRNSGTEVCDGVTENLKLGQESFNLSYHLLVEMSLEKKKSVGAWHSPQARSKPGYMYHKCTVGEAKRSRLS